MTDADHIKAFRLFELSHAESVGKDFQLDEWETEHLLGCAECRGVYEVFVRQLKGRAPLSADARNLGIPPISRTV